MMKRSCDEDNESARPYRYEVDLGMLPKGASASQLDPFCRVLQKIMDGGDTDLAAVVPCFVANNDGACGHQLAWGWPTLAEWNDALREVFSVVPFPTEEQRKIQKREATKR